MPALLDILDSNLQLWHGSAHLQSPGYALLEGREYRFGQEARAAARLRPRDINTRFWWQLSTETLQPAMGSARHTADLVHAHLLALHREGGQPSEVLLAVPGSMQREQLALLLGIVQQCPFDAVGLVNRSVALGSLFTARDRLYHLEIQLHQAVVTELAAGDSEITQERNLPLPGCGMLQLQERLVEIIAAAFIRQTRFDPRRKAATEQQLYDALPDALRRLAGSSETNVEINGYRARINAAELQQAGQRLFQSLAEALGGAGSDARIIADPLAGLLPGLTAGFSGLEVLAPGALQGALEAHRDTLIQREQALSFVLSLPVLGAREQQPAPAEPAVSEPTAPAPAPPPAPTHLLRGARAEPLGAGPVTLANGWNLARSTSGWRLQGSGQAPLVNEVSYANGQLLARGDRIRVEGEPELLLIEVSPDGQA